MFLYCQNELKSESKKIRQSQKLKIVQNPQFWFNQADFPAKSSTYEMVIVTKFHMDWTKIVNVTLFSISESV